MRAYGNYDVMGEVLPTYSENSYTLILMFVFSFVSFYEINLKPRKLKRINKEKEFTKVNLIDK